MRTTDLTKFDDDGFVLHFGGRTHEVDAFTFGNALVSFAEAIQSINREVNPEFKIEISIDSVGPGSFRVCLKTVKKSLKSLFSESPRHIVVSLLASYLLEKNAESSDGSPRVSVDENAVNINAVPAPSEGDSRYKDHDAFVSIHKAVFERSRRKWEFIWNGFRISGTITDKEFFDRLEGREVSIRQGDIYEATLRVHQIRDRMTGSWLNERYEIIKMGRLIEQKQDQKDLDI